MKKLLKLLGVLVAILVLGGAVVSCGSSEDSSDKEIANVESGTDTAASDGEIQDVETAEEEATDTETIEEMVLLDENGIKITATGMEDGWFGTDLMLLIENNTAQNLTIQARNASVNGYMVDTMMSVDVAAGKKANDSLTFSTTGLKECNIETVAVMEFAFTAFDTDNWEDYMTSSQITVETSAAATYEQTYDDSGTVFYDADGIKIIGKGLSADDSIWGPGLMVYIENNTEKNFTVQVRDTSVNGFMVDTSMSQDVLAGKKAITAVTFFSESLEANGITDITDIETSFHVFDMESWNGILDTEAITINF